MPFDDDCVNRHRNGFNAGCNGCSENSQHYTLSRMADLEPLANTIIKTILKKKAWESCGQRVSSIMRYAVYEMCINAVEHGILNLDCDDKKRIIRKKVKDEYEGYVEAMWYAADEPVTVSLCISDELILLGAHDNGKGFNYDQDRFFRIPEDKILEPCGRGLAMLRSFGVRLFWNDKGNTILCALNRSDLI